MHSVTKAFCAPPFGLSRSAPALPLLASAVPVTAGLDFLGDHVRGPFVGFRIAVGVEYPGAHIPQERIDAMPPRLAAHRREIVGLVLGNQRRGDARASR